MATSLGGAGKYRFKRLRRSKGSKDDSALLFENSDSDEVTVYDASIELRQRGTPPDQDHGDSEAVDSLVEYIRHSVTSTDTIQGLALKYRCPVGQIKLLNNLHGDRDLHAVAAIRIPVPKHSVFAACQDSSDKPAVTPKGEGGDIFGDGPPESPTKATPDNIEQYWRHIDETVQRVADKELIHRDSQVFPSGLHYMASGNSRSSQPATGSWCWIITSLILVAVVIPAFYALYIILHTDHNHNPFHLNGHADDVELE